MTAAMLFGVLLSPLFWWLLAACAALAACALELDRRPREGRRCLDSAAMLGLVLWSVGAALALAATGHP